MNITLCDFDGKIPNLALMRLSSYHKACGDSVKLRRGSFLPELFDNPDLVYLSCLFSWNRERATRMAVQFSGRCIIGGTGIDATIQLPEEIDNYEPDYSLYPEAEYAIGFISRGCPRHCPWCVVPIKEGKIRRVNTAQGIVGNRNRAIFLDNNWLAMDGWENDAKWLIENSISVDFNQALDARLIDQNAAILLRQIHWNPGIRISMDSTATIRHIRQGIENLLSAGFSASSIHVFALIGHDGIASDFERLSILHELGVTPFPMGYREIATGKEPATGWPISLYRKYKRLIIRLPMCLSVWSDFRREVLEVAYEAKAQPEEKQPAG